eukprot:XP_001705962.1 Hypothetical protein GL50803_6966 [Giardia lamblia ATCC 50803]
MLDSVDSKDAVLYSYLQASAKQGYHLEGLAVMSHTVGGICREHSSQ